MPGMGEARSCSGRVPGMWLATSARASTLGSDCGSCAGAALQAAAPHSASHSTDFLAIMGISAASPLFCNSTCAGGEGSLAGRTKGSLAVPGRRPGDAAPPASAARMVLCVQLFQALARDVRVDLCGRQVIKKKKNLKQPEVSAMIEQQGHKALLQGVSENLSSTSDL